MWRESTVVGYKRVQLSAHPMTTDRRALTVKREEKLEKKAMNLDGNVYPVGK